MIYFSNVSFNYQVTDPEGQTRIVTGLRNISLKIRKGEFVVLTGGSGCGKTTLIRLINGLIPHFYTGERSGNILLDGKDIAEMSLYEISEKVGSVFQNPKSQFFNVNTTDELAFAAENQGRDPLCIRREIQRTASLLGIEKLLDRNIFELSGGEKQIIACGGIQVLSPDVIVLDEPSSNLDHQAIGKLKQILNLWKQTGKTVVIAEHRLFYLKDLADRMVVLEEGRIKREFRSKEFQKLSFEETQKLGIRTLNLSDVPFLQDTKEMPEKYIVLDGLSFLYKDREHGIQIPKLEIPEGEITAIIGCNGAGKSTLVRNICGLEKRCKGYLTYRGRRLGTRERLHNCYMILQDVNHQLFTESVEDEVMLSMTDKGLGEDEKKHRAEKILTRLDLEGKAQSHPMALSGGQKQRCAIASGIASSKPILIFDEPTSGLDLQHMKQVAEEIRSLQKMGKTILIVTHDYELILRCCDFIVQMDRGAVQDAYRIDEGSIRKLRHFMCALEGENEHV